MPNAKDITSGKSNILLIGDAGTHKTWLSGHAPKPYVFDFDAGVTTLRGLDVEYDVFKDLSRFDATGKNLWQAEKWHNDQGMYTFGYGWDAFYAKLLEKVKLIQTKAPNAPQTLVFDSLTMMSMIAVNKILKDTNQPMPHQGTWGAHHEYFKSIFSMVTALPVRLICTAHISRDTNDLQGTTEKLPLLAGKLAAMIPVFFDEVYFCNAEVETSGNVKYFINSKRTPQMTQAKSRWNVPDKTPMLWTELEKFYGKA